MSDFLEVKCLIHNEFYKLYCVTKVKLSDRFPFSYQEEAIRRVKCVETDHQASIMAFIHVMDVEDFSNEV